MTNPNAVQATDHNRIFRRLRRVSQNQQPRSNWRRRQQTWSHTAIIRQNRVICCCSEGLTDPTSVRDPVPLRGDIADLWAGLNFVIGCAGDGGGRAFRFWMIQEALSEGKEGILLSV